MKIGIICAIETELAPFLQKLEGERTAEKAVDIIDHVEDSNNEI